MPKNNQNNKTSSKKPTSNYQALKAELDTIMEDLQREDLDIDEALRHYQRGLELVGQLEQYLEMAENRVIELKAKFSTAPK